MPFPNNTSVQLTSQLIASNLSATIAAAVKAAGVPPIDNPASVGIVFNQSIAAGGSYTTAHMDMSRYQSIVGTLFAQEQLGGGLGVSPYMRTTLQWSLVSDNYDPLVTEDWVPAIGPLSFVNNYRNDYASPAYGDTLTMTVFNYDSKAINFTFGFFGSFRTRSRSVMRGRYPDDYSAEVNGTGGDDILCSFNPGAIAAGASSTVQLLQLWEGPATIGALCGNTPGVGTVLFTVTPQPVAVLGSNWYFLNDQPNTLTPTPIILPRRVCTLKITNNSAVGINPTVLITGEVQPN